MTDQRLATLIRQLQGLLGGQRVISGGVTSLGVAYGARADLFTASRTAVGTYVVLYTTKFTIAPAVQIGSDNGTDIRGFWSGPPVGTNLDGFTAHILNGAGAAVDASWNFHVIG